MTYTIESVTARQAHVRLTEQFAEGLSENAIDTLAVAHDLLNNGMSADEVHGLLRTSQRLFPVEVADVWPKGTPDRWVLDCVTLANENGYTTPEQVDWWLWMFGCGPKHQCSPCAARYPEAVASC